MLAQGNDGGRVAGDFLGGRGNGAEEGSGAFRAQGVDGFWGEGGAGGEEVVISGRESGECEREAGEVRGEGFEDEAACLGRSAGFCAWAKRGCGERCKGETDWYNFTADTVARQ